MNVGNSIHSKQDLKDPHEITFIHETKYGNTIHKKKGEISYATDSHNERWTMYLQLNGIYHYTVNGQKGNKHMFTSKLYCIRTRYTVFRIVCTVIQMKENVLSPSQSCAATTSRWSRCFNIQFNIIFEHTVFIHHSVRSVSSFISQSSSKCEAKNEPNTHTEKKG